MYQLGIIITSAVRGDKFKFKGNIRETIKVWHHYGAEKALTAAAGAQMILRSSLNVSLLHFRSLFDSLLDSCNELSGARLEAVNDKFMMFSVINIMTL